MISISLCLIAKNEEEAIARCLESVHDAVDEIIVVDTGSTDKTKLVSKKYNAKIYNFEWIDDFAAARNFAFSKATKEYIFWLDCDDILYPEDKEEFIKLKKTLSKTIDAVGMNYILTVDSNGNPTNSLKRYRLVKRSRNFKWIGHIHEFLNVSGTIIDANVSVRHMKNKPYTDRNLKIFRKMIDDNVEFSTREKYYYANELYDNKYYYEALNTYEEFLECKDAFIGDIKSACIKMANCYHLKNDKKNELECLFREMEYDIPTSEICCRVGLHFLEQKKYKPASFWYELAIQNKPVGISVELINHDAYTWVPYLQLCVCYYCLKDYEKAYFCNEEASKYVPDHPSIKNNRECLGELLKTSKNVMLKKN